MKKKQLDRKLSLNKQTISQLDAKALNTVRGGAAVTTQDKSDSCTLSWCNCA